MTGDGSFSRGVNGVLEVEGPFDCLINDPTSVLTGNIEIGNAAKKNMWVRRVGSTLFLNSLEVKKSQPLGNIPVVDSFLRTNGRTSMGTPQPFGLADVSYHCWVPDDGSTGGPGYVVDANGVGMNSSPPGGWKSYLPNTPPYTSRHLSRTITTSPTTHRALMGFLFRAAGTGNYLSVAVDGTTNQRVALYTGTFGTGATLVTSAAATINASSSYLLDVYVLSSTKPNSCVEVRVYLAGVFMFAYTLKAAQAAAYLVTGFDGVGGYVASTADDGGSRITNFSITPASDLPYVAAGTVTLAAGTVTVANTVITANTIVRIYRTTTGGTTGQLSYTLSAGTSFTVNSSSGSDTSSVYYEIVNY
jgi:hypothetical protein